MMRIAIIGAGASGMLLGGLLSAESGYEVHCFEKADRPLKKLLATGNGRCNFTNVHREVQHYTGGSATFVDRILRRDGEAALRLFERMGMPATALESGMMYPMTMMSATVADKLIALNASGGTIIHTATEIVDMRKDTLGFTLFSDGAEGSDRRRAFDRFDAVVLSSGGAYGVGKHDRSNGYTLAKGFGHSITPLHPGIVALRIAQASTWRALVGHRQRMGVTALDSTGGVLGQYREDVLFTDYGLSGIGVLMASNAVLDECRAGRRAFLELDCLPGCDPKSIIEQVRRLGERFSGWCVAQGLSGWLSNGLLSLLAESVGVDVDQPLNATSQEALNRLFYQAKRWRVEVIGPKKNDRGQITCGGIDTSEIDAETLASKRAFGLYFTGEILDVQGECGGYNLHWAWASAVAVWRALTGQAESQHEEDSCIV